MKKNRYRTIWISDLHLGKKGICAEELVRFLKTNTADTIYLVGDIIDIWALERRVYLPASHMEVIKQLLMLYNSGVNVVYVVGNHDELLRSIVPISIANNISIVNETIHETKANKKFLVIHGDQFDQITRYAKWMAVTGDIGYNFLLSVNKVLNFVRRNFGLGYWSLSAAVKYGVKMAVNFVSHYEEAVVKYVQKQTVDGVICGHIHHAEMRKINEIDYINCGDWVESCTAIVEQQDGTLELIRWNA